MYVNSRILGNSKMEKNNLLYLKKQNKLPNHTTNKEIQKNRYLNYWNNNIEKEFKKLYPNKFEFYN